MGARTGTTSSIHMERYEAVAAQPDLHAGAIVEMDCAWVAEGIARFRGSALTERDVPSPSIVSITRSVTL